MELIKDRKLLHQAIALQRAETTEYVIYTELAAVCKDKGNADVLREIAAAEAEHAEFWRQRTGLEVKVQRFKVFRRVLLARLFGLTFVLKRMEKKEGTAAHLYGQLSESIPEAERIMKEEAEHENRLLSMLDEELLKYAGSIVLGLNDALVELTGSLAGFTFALGDPRTVSIAGLVTGISAAFSMGASAYLSSRADNDPRALRSAFYTGVAYLITVVILIMPYLLLQNIFISLLCTLILAVFIIFAFNYYLSVAQDLDFKKRFLEMASISLGVAALSFGVGWLLKNVIGINA
jgi:VIT1/CCC1 family predicted Fe2+/Mn2+ transporter